MRYTSERIVSVASDYECRRGHQLSEMDVSTMATQAGPALPTVQHVHLHGAASFGGQQKCRKLKNNMKIIHEINIWN